MKYARELGTACSECHDYVGLNEAKVCAACWGRMSAGRRDAIMGGPRVVPQTVYTPHPHWLRYAALAFAAGLAGGAAAAGLARAMGW